MIGSPDANSKHRCGFEPAAGTPEAIAQPNPGEMVK